MHRYFVILLLLCIGCDQKGGDNFQSAAFVKNDKVHIYFNNEAYYNELKNNFSEIFKSFELKVYLRYFDSEKKRTTHKFDYDSNWFKRSTYTDKYIVVNMNDIIPNLNQIRAELVEARFKLTLNKERLRLINSNLVNLGDPGLDSGWLWYYSEKNEIEWEKKKY